MLCPRCGEDDDKVIDSRSSEGGAVIRRRRECLACGMRFTTYERMQATGRLVVVKKDGARVPYDRSNVLRGIIAACGKRPVSEDRKEAVADAVEIEVRQAYDREVPSVEIGRRVAARLRDVDPIAYIRYASEYYEFRTLEDLAKEVSREQSRARPAQGQGEFFQEQE